MRERERKSAVFAKRLRKEMPNAEVMLWSHLRRDAIHGCRFRRQHPIGPYIADFACVSARLVIEIDGATHGSKQEIEHDRRRDAYMTELGWRVLRVTNTDIYRNLDDVVDVICKIVPPPRPMGGPPP